MIVKTNRRLWMLCICFMTAIWAAMTRYVFVFCMASALLAAITESNVAFAQTKKTESVAKYLIPGDKPYPTDKAPKAVKSLIQDGTITLVFNSDPEFVKRDTGKAHYYLGLTQKYGYSFSKAKKDDVWQVKVVAKQVEPTVRIEHVVRLPSKYKTDTVWNGRLLRHEFDHIAISLDPRPVLLLEHLCRSLPPLKRALEPGEEPSDAVYKRIINEEITLRREAVENLIQANYVLLDQVSTHGKVPIPKRAEFFGKLFTKENLAEQNFPYVDAVLDLLNFPEYQQAELRFLPRDPTEPAGAKVSATDSAQRRTIRFRIALASSGI